MDHLHIRTSGGVFGFVGQLYGDRQRPLLLAVNGSFPRREYLHDLVTTFPGANVLIAYLPGMGPPWTPTTVPELTQGLAEAVQRLAGDVPTVVYGASTGNLLALGLASPTITRKVAAEPFLTTAGLTPFLSFARENLERRPQADALHAYLDVLFGVHADGRQEDRDYGYLAEAITVPTDVVVGSWLDPWAGKGAPWPSLTSAEDRARLAANPLVTLHVVGKSTGHGVAVDGEGKALVEQLILQGLLEASKLCV